MHPPLLLQCFHVSPFQCQLVWHLHLKRSRSIQLPLGNSIFILTYNQLQLNGWKSNRWKAGDEIRFTNCLFSLWHFCLCWIAESRWVLLGAVAWWVVGRVCNVVKLPSAMIRHHQRCAAKVPELDRSEASVRKGWRQQQHLRWRLCHQKSPLVASKHPCRSEAFSKGFLNRLVMTMVCDSPFRLPCCLPWSEAGFRQGEVSVSF